LLSGGLGGNKYLLIIQTYQDSRILLLNNHRS
jgi:hypothetical protein